MANIKITADSTCDLSKALLEKYDISLAPLYITMDGAAYKDGLEITPQDIYAYVDKTGDVTKTAAVSTEDYLTLFRPYVEQGKAVVHITISHDMSSCYQNALLAAAELGNVYVVDSLNLSTGSGHLVLRAAELAAEGVGAADIKAQLDELAPKVEASFVIDTLKYLHKGGRCSTVAALGANLLGLKPCIEVKGGNMSVGKKYRGKLDKCLAEYVAERLQGRTDIDTRRIFVTHTAMPAGSTEAVIALVKKQMQFDEVLETMAGCTITNHCGPGTLGILFIRK